MNQSSRTEEWLRHAANPGSSAELISRLSGEHVALVLEPDVTDQPHAQLLASLAVNLLARLWPVVPRLSIVIPKDAKVIAAIPRWQARSFSNHLTAMLTALAPPLAWDIASTVPATATVCLVIGEGGTPPDCALFVGSRGWSVFFSPTEPEQTDGAPNPVGAYAAACMGVAEVWKRLLFAHRALLAGVPIAPIDRRLIFSTISYSQRDEQDVLLPSDLSIGRLTIVGTGAGGGAAAFTLASVPALSGHINLIDPDEVDSTNLNRYVFADASDVDGRRHKVAIVARLFEHLGRVNIAKYPEAFASAVRTLPPEDFQYTLAAVHSRAARRDIQLETPMVLWDCGAAEYGEFRIWRLLLGVTECMYCKHPRNDSDAEVLKACQWEKVLGLDPTLTLQKVKDNSLITDDEIASIRTHLAGVDVPFDLHGPVNDSTIGKLHSAGGFLCPSLTKEYRFLLPPSWQAFSSPVK